MLAENPATDATSGVRVSCSPRSTPVAASATSIAGMPRAEMRRYVTAYPIASGEAPKTRHSGSAARATPTEVRAPSPTASQVPSMPASRAPRSLPAPIWRATMEVVP